MAISKQQPMRPAEIALVDASNQHELTLQTHAQSLNTLETFASRFKIGYISNITIPANDSVSTSETFAEPFAQDDVCVLFAQVVANDPANLFTYTLVACAYSGFSYSIANSDAEAHTVSLGYVAVKVN